MSYDYDINGELKETPRKIRSIDIIATIIGTLVLLTFLGIAVYMTKELARLEHNLSNSSNPNDNDTSISQPESK
jgi:hypothetical protein